MWQLGSLRLWSGFRFIFCVFLLCAIYCYNLKSFEFLFYCLLVVFDVSLHKNNGKDFWKLGGRIGYGPSMNPLIYDVYPDKEPDLGISWGDCWDLVDVYTLLSFKFLCYWQDIKWTQNSYKNTHWNAEVFEGICLIFWANAGKFPHPVLQSNTGHSHT